VVIAYGHLDSVARDMIAASLAVAMGAQNAVARRLAVPDLTTTVLTMTLTGIAADFRGEHRREALQRRFLAVATMLGGGLAGAELVLHPPDGRGARDRRDGARRRGRRQCGGGAARR